MQMITRGAGFDRVTVTAALIVRDEERFLPGCLDSLAGKVDEVVIVDTGSQDRTVEVATKSGSRVFHHLWEDDFAKARNIALDAASSSWILYIDADERLSLPDGGMLGAYIDPAAAACLVRFRPKSGYTRYLEWRIFRNDPRIRFEGRIHETIVRGIQAVASSDGLKIVRTPVQIDHLGYDGDQAHKHPRNLPLLERCVRDRPERIYYWYHLTETLAALGRVEEAIAIGEEGLARAMLALSDKDRADCSLLIQILARLRLDRKEDSLDLLEEGLSRVPEDHALRFLKARALIEAGDPEAALEMTEYLLAINPAELVDGLIAFDESIFRERACELAAIASLRMGRRNEACHYFLKAAAFAPQELHYAIKAAALGGRRNA